MSKSKLLFAALCLSGATGMAQARGADVQWSVTLGSPIYAAPIYAAPAASYVRPAPVYVQPVPVWGPPARVYVPQGYRTVSHWDNDGDGIPNRHDRLYNPRWDRDGDGVPNRRDRHDNAQRGDPRGSWGHRPDRQDGPGRRGD
jgi:hypothetical protein